MQILGLMRVRNGGNELVQALDSFGAFCDDIYVVDDRSDDDTAEILDRHPGVTNAFRARASLPDDRWLIPESAGLELLYRMADFCRPDWIAMLDHDQVIQTHVDIRQLLAGLPTNIVGISCPLTSTWNDPEYPHLVPLLGAATSNRCSLWRYFPNLRSGNQELHNPRAPVNLLDYGVLHITDEMRILHSGWDTLAKRISKAHFYLNLDPHSWLNHGIPYDRSLLFGFTINQIDALKQEYQSRFEAKFGGSPDVAVVLPQARERDDSG